MCTCAHCQQQGKTYTDEFRRACLLDRLLTFPRERRQSFYGAFRENHGIKALQELKARVEARYRAQCQEGLF